MAVTAHATGTHTPSALNTTEDIAAAITAAGVYVLQVDVNALADGETLLLRSEIRILSGGTTRLASETPVKDAQAEPIKFTIPWPTDGVTGGLLFRARQEGGTIRSFPWKILKIG